MSDFTSQAPRRNSDLNPLRDHSRRAMPVLMFTRIVVVAITMLTIILDAVSIPAAYHLLQTPCSPCDPNSIQMTTLQAQAASESGLSLQTLALYPLALIIITEAVYTGVGVLLLLRRSDDPMALFTALTLTTFGGAAFTGTMHALSSVNVALWLLVATLNIIGQSSFITFLYVFPTGHFVPRWTIIPTIAWTLAWVTRLFPASEITALANSLTAGPLFVVLLLMMIVTQVYRYHRVSTPAQRQQTKWAVFGLGAGLAGFTATITIGNVLLPPSIANAVVPTMLATGILYLCFLVIPISITIAIMRSRLYDIDILINRTLVYGSLTAILAALYFALVIGAQLLTRQLTGQQTTQQPLVIVLSTLLIAALVQPLRRGVQRTIDRRFYRSRYDAARTIAAFSATLRQEVELSSLRAHLLSVVEDTMQPSHASLWLTQPKRLDAPASDTRRHSG